MFPSLQTNKQSNKKLIDKIKTFNPDIVCTQYMV